MVEWTIFVVGVLLLFVVAPLVGAIPGPGGIFVVGVGLAMVLKTSMWAKRRYVQFKRWQPKAGGWTDWALAAPERTQAPQAPEGTRGTRRRDAANATVAPTLLLLRPRRGLTARAGRS